MYYDIESMPDKIRVSLGSYKTVKGELLFFFKTAYKPSHSIPIVWFLMYTDGLVLSTTYKPSVYKEILKLSINCIRLVEHMGNNNALTILYSDTKLDDFTMPIPKNVDLSELKTKLEANGIEVLTGR